jgi:hypothetical protein
MPIVLVLLGAVLLIGISTAYNAMTGSQPQEGGSGKEHAPDKARHRRSTAGNRFREATAIDRKERR